MHFRYTGTQTKCINLGSYSYLGFAENSGICAETTQEAILKYGTSLGSPALELGTTPLLEELERTTAEFHGVEAAVAFSAGFVTNSYSIPCLMGPDTLVLSDEKNHSSIVLGLRISGEFVEKL